MKSFKKSLVFFVIFALVLSVVSPALAATATDVVGTSYEDAVVRMGALGIINGYPDGTFKPENNITRAEFAKIACYLVGQQDAATLSAGSVTKFNDVPASHWAAGYISIAVNQNIIKGYPDGTFKPEANVSYAEAITMLVRALGMASVVEGKGTWPANYMSKAAEIGITDEVTGLNGTDKAIRGNIAKLAWNTLTEQKWGATGYNDKGEVTYGPLSNKTLLSDKYKDYAFADGTPKVIKNALVTATKVSDLTADPLIGNDTIKVTLDEEIGGWAAGATKYFEAKDFDLTFLGGKYVEVMLGKDNKVVSIKVDSTKTKEGILEKVDVADSKVTISGTQYTMATTNAVKNFRTVVAGLANIKTLVDSKKVIGASVTLNDDGKAEILSLLVPDDAAQLVVDEVTSKNVVESVNNEVGTFDLDVITGEDGSANKAYIYKNGVKATMADIKAGDVVNKIDIAGGYYIVLVTDNKVTGKVTNVTKDGDITINGKVFKAAKTNLIGSTTGKVDDADDLTDATVFFDKDVTLYTNPVGQYVFANGATSASADYDYGMVTQSWLSDTPDSTGKLAKYIEIRNAAGEKKVYTVKGTDTDVHSVVSGGNLADGSAWADNIIAAHSLIQYKVNSDGTIDVEDIVDLTVLNHNDAVDTAKNVNEDKLETDVAAIEFRADGYNDNNESLGASTDTDVSDAAELTLYKSADTIVYNARNDEVISWGTIFDDYDTNVVAGAPTKVATDMYAIYETDTKDVKVLVVYAGTAVTSSDYYGVLTSDFYRSYDADGNGVWKVKAFANGINNEYEVGNSVTVTKGVYSEYEVGDGVQFTLDTDGKIATNLTMLFDASEAADDPSDAETVDRVYGTSRIYFEDGSVANLASDVKVIDATGTTPVGASVSAIKENSVVKCYDNANADSQYKVVIIVK